MSLHELPVELLHRIAAECSVRDITALSSTCHSLRARCLDSAVFQERAQHLMPCDALVTFPDTSSLFHFLRCHVDTATADAPGLTWVWSQIALAAERLATIKDDLKTLNPDFARKERVSRAMATVLAQSRIEGGSVTDPMMRVSLLKERLPAIEAEIDLQIQNEGDSTREMLVRTISLLSTVIVWGYPSLCGDYAVGSLKSLCGFFCSPEHPQALEYAFCLAVSSLGTTYWQEWVPRYRRAFDREDEYNINLSGNWGAWINLGLDEDAITSQLWANEDSDDTRGTHIFLISIAIISSTLQRMDVRRPWAKIKAPHPDKLDLLGQRDGSKLTVPLPDWCPPPPESGYPYKLSSSPGSLSWARWYQERVEALVRNICEGEWYGYSELGVGAYTSDSVCARSIRFHKIREGGQDDRRRLLVRAADAVQARHSFAADEVRGPLTVAGWVAPRSGRVCLRMQYGNGQGEVTYDWRGQMTPVGISGNCYQPGETVARRGKFWLWRKEWMDEDDMGIAHRTLPALESPSSDSSDNV